MKCQGLVEVLARWQISFVTGRCSFSMARTSLTPISGMVMVCPRPPVDL